VIAVTQNGHNRFQDSMSIAEIKEKAKYNVQKEARGASPLTLLKTARSQSLVAQALEDAGDLKRALDALTKVASLVRMFMDSAEFASEKSSSGKHGMLYKEFSDFMAVCQSLSLPFLKRIRTPHSMTAAISYSVQRLWKQG
jgi:ubiquitin carboxyl-terminal hydrolase 8